MLSGQITKYGMQDATNSAFTRFDRMVKRLIEDNLDNDTTLSSEYRDMVKGLLANSEEIASLMFVQLCESSDGQALLTRIANEAGLEIR